MTEPDTVLADLARVLTSLGPALAPRGSEALLRSITVSARELFGAAACSLALLSDDGSELVFTTASGTGSDSVVDLRIPAGQGIAGWVVMSEQAISVSDLQHDTRFASDVAENTGYVPNAILAVPVAGPRGLLGVIEVLDRDAGRPGAEHDMRLLSLFADQAAIAIENSRVFADLGRAVLEAVANAAPGTALAASLSSAARETTGPDLDLLTLAALFGELDEIGADERRLAIAVVEDLLVYFRGRGRRPS
jgi:GAF domain-containing protein